MDTSGYATLYTNFVFKEKSQFWQEMPSEI